MKLHCHTPVCTYKGAEELQLIFKNTTIKIFNLYHNIVCNTNCLIIILIHAIEQIYSLYLFYLDLLLINYSAHTEVEIHAFYFLLRVPWQQRWKLIILSSFSIHEDYKKLNFFIQFTKFLQISKRHSPSHLILFGTPRVSVRADGQSKLAHNTTPFQSKTEKWELIIPKPQSEKAKPLLLLNHF